MAEKNSYTADRRLYLDKDGKVVEANDPNKVSLLVSAGGVLPYEAALQYGLIEAATEQKSEAQAPRTKAIEQAPNNKGKA
jgi:hypothetical protein